MPEQVREVVADPALAVMQVGVADAARLHPDQRLAGSGIGHQDLGDLGLGAFAAGNNALYLVCHRASVLSRVTPNGSPSPGARVG